MSGLNQLGDFKMCQVGYKMQVGASKPTKHELVSFDYTLPCGRKGASVFSMSPAHKVGSKYVLYNVTVTEDASTKTGWTTNFPVFHLNHPLKDAELRPSALAYITGVLHDALCAKHFGTLSINLDRPGLDSGPKQAIVKWDPNPMNLEFVFLHSSEGKPLHRMFVAVNQKNPFHYTVEPGIISSVELMFSLLRRQGLKTVARKGQLYEATDRKERNLPLRADRRG